MVRVLGAKAGTVLMRPLISGPGLVMAAGLPAGAAVRTAERAD